MSQERKNVIRLFLPPIRTGRLVLNLRTGRVEHVSGYGGNGEVRTYESAQDSLPKDSVILLKDAPQRLLKNIGSYVVNAPIPENKRKAA